MLAACGSAAPASAPPSQALPPAAASAKPNTAPSASTKPAASAAASAKPAPAPTPTFAPAVEADTTKVDLTRTDVPPAKGKTLNAPLLEVDQQAHMLYLADRTAKGVDVFDVSAKTPKYVTTIDTGAETRAVAVAEDLKKVYASLADSNVAVIDVDPKSPTANKVAAKVSTGGKTTADDSTYDPKTKKLYVANNDDGFVSAVDTAQSTIAKKIDNLGEELDQPRINPKDGMIYMVSSAQNAILQFDPARDALVKKFDVGDDCQPLGLAINPTANIGLLGCSNTKKQHIAIWDFGSQKVTATADNSGAVDQVAYAPKTDRFVTASWRFFRGPAIGIFNGKDGKFITNVPAASGHEAGLDDANGVVYTTDPTAAALLSFPLPAK